MKELFYFWLVIALTFVLFEIAHPGLFLFLSFALGACGAAVASWLGYTFIAQCSIALGSTLVGLLLLYGWLRAKGYAGPKHGAHPSNIYALPGKRATVIKAIGSDRFGQVKLDGEIWSARSIHGKPIDLGRVVEVTHLRGAHVVVKELNI